MSGTEVSKTSHSIAGSGIILALFGHEVGCSEVHERPGSIPER